MMIPVQPGYYWALGKWDNAEWHIYELRKVFDPHKRNYYLVAYPCGDVDSFPLDDFIDWRGPLETPPLPERSE